MQVVVQAIRGFGLVVHPRLALDLPSVPVADGRREAGREVSDDAITTIEQLLAMPLVDLDPELADHLREGVVGGSAIKHPLVQSMFHHPRMNAMANAQLAEKRKRLAEAETGGDWHTYVFLHERPWRAEALAEIADRLDGPTYWALLSVVWIDSENIVEMRWLWDELLADDRDGREDIMHDDELVELAELPDVIKVFQGHTTERNDGWSWTTQRHTAEWFARRFADLEQDSPRVSVGVVRKSAVLAYFTRRSEAEVLVDPEAVELIDTYQPGPEQGRRP